MICKTFLKDIEGYILGKKGKVLKVFEDMIADMVNNTKLYPIVTNLFTKGRKLNISTVFVTQSYFKVPKQLRLNASHLFIIKILNKRQIQQIALNHSLDIDFIDFMKIHKKCNAGAFIFFVNHTTLLSDNKKKVKAIRDDKNNYI